MKMLNLDYLCMEYAQRIMNKEREDFKTLTNNLRKALGVLQEDGVYAMFLWLEDKDKKVEEHLIELLNEERIKKILLNSNGDFPRDFISFCEKLKEVAEDIDKLFFMKKILERTIIYALYHAKVGEKDE